MKKSNSDEFAAIILILGVAVIALVAFVVYKNVNQSSNSSSTGSGSSVSVKENDKEPPLKIKNIGINLAEYNPATNKAGDVVFTKTGLESYGNILFFGYGAVAKANSAARERKNPQPTFILPLGTKVRSMVDGEVVKIEKLYSNDYSVMVATKKDSQWIYELEHVINPVVKVGDKVKAGQVVAEVSTHDSQYHPGFGLYEIGILHAGNPPQHVCLFNYLDDSIKAETLANIKSLYASWETYMGDTSLYNEANASVPGCQTLDPIEG